MQQSKPTEKVAKVKNPPSNEMIQKTEDMSETSSQPVQNGVTKPVLAEPINDQIRHLFHHTLHYMSDINYAFF